MNQDGEPVTVGISQNSVSLLSFGSVDPFWKVPNHIVTAVLVKSLSLRGISQLLQRYNTNQQASPRSFSLPFFLLLLPGNVSSAHNGSVIVPSGPKYS